MAGVDPSTLSLEMLIQTSDKSRLIGEAVRAQLQKNLGVDVRLQPFEHRAFRAQLDLGAYPLFQLQWSADYPDAENFLSVFLPGSGNNRTGWRSSSYPLLLQDAATASTAGQRSTRLSSADELLVDRDVVIVPLYHSRLSVLISRRSRGVRLSPMNYLFVREVSVD
jgi:ABC-type oligopeptide transport system substrate-binding subunit